MPREPRREGLARETPSLGLVRGILAERVVISTPGDPWLDLKAAAEHTSLSRRTLQAFTADPLRPLPHYRPGGGGKILLRRSELDAYLMQFRVDRAMGVDVDALLRDVTSSHAN